MPDSLWFFLASTNYHPYALAPRASDASAPFRIVLP
jgi:hypothetical protein